MDVYRLSDESELDETGYEDCLQTGELNVIEWADRIAGRLPEGALFIEMSPGAEDANARILTVKTDDEILFTALREALDAYTCD
jgi:tRNA A37 threonylcarbamoyladenosine biosynthesis protein TsaE